MNRKQRRALESRNPRDEMIHFRGRSYTVDEAGTLAAKEHLLKSHQTALELYDLILKQRPGHGVVHAMRGVLLQAMRRYDEALASCDKALALMPGSPEAHNIRGVILTDTCRYAEALESYAGAAALKPDFAEAHLNHGKILHSLQRFDHALESYGKVIALDPACADAYLGRAATLYKTQRYTESAADFEKAAMLAPDGLYALGELLYIRRRLCLWQDIDRLADAVAKGIDAGKPVCRPFVAAAVLDSASRQKKCAEIYLASQYPQPVQAWNGPRYSHDKIRLGYFSADFYNHATAYLMAGLFEQHDREKFEVIAFSYGPPSAHDMRGRLEKAFDSFIDMHGKSDRDIAALAGKHEIDIAIDLKGFTDDARPGIFAARPAPVQVNYLGYPGTAGASYMDYLIADAVIIPEEHKRYYAEKIVYLPHSYQANDSKRKISDAVLTRAHYNLPEKGFVFCSFNHHYKITPEAFAIWMRLLHKVEGSVLWLYVNNQVAAHHLQEEAKKLGIPAYRLVFTAQVEPSEHLARHRLADLFLDTLVCNAHTTASDALWAGLPLLTCLGETFAGRVAASLLHAVGMPELVAYSPAEYEALAFELAADPIKLSAIRQKLSQNRLTHPLFDTKVFTRDIEAAYIRMHELHQLRQPAAQFHVSP